MSKLQITYDRSPIGITKIIGNAHGIQSISLLDSIDSMEQETPEEELAECLHKAKKQLQEYFEGNRKENFTPELYVPRQKKDQKI